MFLHFMQLSGCMSSPLPLRRRVYPSSQFAVPKPLKSRVREIRGACKQQFGLLWGLKGAVIVGDRSLLPLPEVSSAMADEFSFIRSLARRLPALRRSEGSGRREGVIARCAGISTPLV